MHIRMHAQQLYELPFCFRLIHCSFEIIYIRHILFRSLYLLFHQAAEFDAFGDEKGGVPDLGN